MSVFIVYRFKDHSDGKDIFYPKLCIAIFSTLEKAEDYLYYKNWSRDYEIKEVKLDTGKEQYFD